MFWECVLHSDYEFANILEVAVRFVEIEVNVFIVIFKVNAVVDFVENNAVDGVNTFKTLDADNVDVGIRKTESVFTIVLLEDVIHISVSHFSDKVLVVGDAHNDAGFVSDVGWECKPYFFNPVPEGVAALAITLPAGITLLVMSLLIKVTKPSA